MKESGTLKCKHKPQGAHRDHHLVQAALLLDRSRIDLAEPARLGGLLPVPEPFLDAGQVLPSVCAGTDLPFGRRDLSGGERPRVSPNRRIEQLERSGRTLVTEYCSLASKSGLEAWTCSCSDVVMFALCQ